MVVAPFEIHSRVAAGVRRLTLAGELDLASAPGLTRCLDALQDAEDIPTEIDLAEVTFLDARGLRVLIQADDRLNRPGGLGLRLIRPSRAVRRMFELAGVSGRLPPQT